ncbi:hypothetical protein QBC42DRAFT_313950 [Cladorrhinum samala]|uniref:Uncharacterized protein n=1 Tax=Cladorrhinum samala TaxID=585594 RepID=A0AAV9HDM1_9PEZI|nr:hypothetical protein QBC42DRAFT_313950 [Cladorrhinum samala]
MSAQQRSSRDISLLDLDRVQVQQHLSEQLPEPTSSPASPEGRQAGKNVNVARESSVPDHSIHRFVPLSRQDETAANLPELNFRPLALALKYLVPLMIWQLLCLFGVITLAVLSRVKPPWLHLESEYSYNVWFYSPGAIGFLTTVLWRGTLQSYNRILPYVRMANVPLDISGGGGAPGSTGQHLLNGIPSGEIHMGVLFSLWRSGDYISLVVNITPIPIIFLTPIKSGILGLVMDESGWGIRISFSFCIMAAIIYVWLFAATLAIALHLRTRRTGLKWNPCTLAAQVSLVQGSNMLDKFADIPTEQWAPLFNTVRDWPGKGLVLRLGYWREQGTDIIVHGVRFLPRANRDAGDEDAQSSSSTDRDDSSPNQNPAGAVQRQDVSKPDVNRFWNSNLQDGYLILVSIIGAGVITVATVAWAKGYIDRPLDVSFLQAPSSGDAESQFFSEILANFARGILFALLPTLAFGIFHNNFLAVDIYRRNMAPVYNMVGPLPEDDQERLIPGTPEEGATARNSMLLDFITPDFITCLVLAGGAGEYRLVLGLVLATFCNLVYIIVGSLFSFELSSVTAGEESGRGQRYNYTATIHRRQFIACYVILIVYCISIWLLRPRGVARTCRRLLTLLDFVSLIHKSHILQCPEFWVQNHWSDTEEHLKSQVTLANRIYRFGVYVGTDDHQYVGISVQKVPETWVESPDYDSTRKSLLFSAELAKDVLRGGLYGESASSGEGLLASRHQAETVDDRVYSNTHPRMWQGMKGTKMRRRRRRGEDVESGIQMQEVRRDQGDTSGAGVAGYAPGLQQTPLADEDEDEQR